MNTYIGNANDTYLRKAATSGGIGSSLLKYSFEKKLIQTAISFYFNEKTLQYTPKLIHCYNDYRITGSIYHEIDLYKFIKENIGNIKEKIFLFALPCQVKPISYILDKNKIEHFIISLTCSSQQTIDASFFLLKNLGLKKHEVKHIQYRGNGWPSGVKIKLKKNESIFVSNLNSIWAAIFHSRLFIQKRCFKCNETISLRSDITLADPWLKKYINNDKIGMSLIIVNTKTGGLLLREAEQAGYLTKSTISKEDVFYSQRSTLNRKASYLKNKKIIQIVIQILFSTFYRKLVLKNVSTFKMHCKIIHKIEHLLAKYHGYPN